MKDIQSSNHTAVTSRRKFIGASAAAAGSIILPVTTSAQVEGNSTIKVALVGCGGRGTGAAEQTLQVEGTKLVAMADVFPERLQQSYQQLERRSKDKVDVPEENRFIGFDAYLKAIEVADVVILTTPPGFRPMMFEAAVEAGKHVFMEKPVATDAPGVRRVIEAAKKADEKKLKVVVGLQRHYEKSYLETLSRIQDGMIGPLLSAQVYWNGGGVWVNERREGESEMHFQVRNWYYFNWLCGDHINEQHIHNIDVANWFFAMGNVAGVEGLNAHPVRAQGMGGREVRTDKKYGEIYDHHYVEFHYADREICNSQCRHIPGCWNSVTESFVGTKGRVTRPGQITDLAGNELWRHRGRNDPNPYQFEHDELHRFIREDIAHNDAYYGAVSTMTAIMGRMATYGGKEVSWEEALNSNLSDFPDRLDFDATPKVLPNEDGSYPIAVPGETQVV